MGLHARRAGSRRMSRAFSPPRGELAVHLGDDAGAKLKVPRVDGNIDRSVAPWARSSLCLLLPIPPLASTGICALSSTQPPLPAFRRDARPEPGLGKRTPGGVTRRQRLTRAYAR